MDWQLPDIGKTIMKNILPSILSALYGKYLEISLGKYRVVVPFHNRFRIGLRFRLASSKESITRRPIYSAKMPIESTRAVRKLLRHCS